MTKRTWIPHANYIRSEGDSYFMYSGTDKTNAEKIVAVGAHEGIYLTTDPDFALNYGDHIVVFLVPKDIAVSPSKEFDFNFEAEMDTWGTHAIIIHKSD